MATCSDCVQLQGVRRTYCDRRARVPARCNFGSESSLNFSCRGYVGKVLGAGFRTLGRMAFGTLRNLVVFLTGDAACICLPILCCPRGKSPSSCAGRWRFVSALARTAVRIRRFD